MIKFHIKHSEEEESVIVCCDNAIEMMEKRAGRTMVFTDTNVFALYRDTVAKYFPNAPVHVMPAGEAHKTEKTLFALLSAMAEEGLCRRDCLVCLGGGVVGDVGALASALYMRGIACYQVPTTLLAQVDSSVGGKTAVDFKGVKNLVGVFKQPRQVLVDGAFLKTLAPREIKSGLGEIIKHAALDGALFDKLVSNKDRLFDLDFLGEIVPENIAVKAKVVQADVREAGLRKCLNLGHTTAHAFELTENKLSHGEYVLVGIIFEAELAKQYSDCDPVYLNELKELALYALGGMPKLPSASAAARAALLDKKNTARGVVTVMAPCKKGEYRLLELPYEEYENALSRIWEELC